MSKYFDVIVNEESQQLLTITVIADSWEEAKKSTELKHSVFGVFPAEKKTKQFIVADNMQNCVGRKTIMKGEDA
tara:strand:- start:83 stop:304 length:222 start_codon:yes stop_codon:yes gene_type:complete